MGKSVLTANCRCTASLVKAFSTSLLPLTGQRSVSAPAPDARPNRAWVGTCVQGSHPKVLGGCFVPSDGTKACINQRFPGKYLGAACGTAAKRRFPVAVLQGARKSPAGAGSDKCSPVQSQRLIAASPLPTLAKWNMLTYRHVFPVHRAALLLPSEAVDGVLRCDTACCVLQDGQFTVTGCLRTPVPSESVWKVLTDYEGLARTYSTVLESHSRLVDKQQQVMQAGSVHSRSMPACSGCLNKLWW